MKTESFGEYLDPRVESGEWRRFHNEELNSLYRSPNIARVIKSRRLRWAGHIARMEEDRCAFKMLDGRTILEWRNARNWVDLAQDRVP